ncbi:hypothetical protein YC2023_049581 [Brassica napus]
MVARFPHFQVILYPNEGDIQSQAGLASVRSDTTSTFTSIAARLEKLRKEKDGVKTEKNGYNNNTREDLKSYKSSPNFHKLNSMIDRNLADTVIFCLQLDIMCANGLSHANAIVLILSCDAVTINDEVY